ncbi:hypothetical protein NDU88_005994, partial [Pleurodeles waltl]
QAAAVREALRIICDAGRDDLIQPGVLSQASIGFECPKRAAAGGVAAAVLACSPPQHRGTKSMNGRCLGEHKQKFKKETALMVLSSLAAAMSSVEVEKRGRGRACIQAPAHNRPVSEGWASEECAPEVGGGLGLDFPAMLAQSENSQYRQGNVPETERLLSNASTKNVKEKIYIFRSLHHRADEVPSEKGF